MSVTSVTSGPMPQQRVATYPNGVKLIKWPHQVAPTAETVAEAMVDHGYKVYDLQTVPAWFVRSRHAHDEPEIRGAVAGVITFHFDEYPVTIEAGDILLIPGGVAHEVIAHNGHTFSAYKGSLSGERKVTEHGDASGSVEHLAQKQDLAREQAGQQSQQ